MRKKWTCNGVAKDGQQHPNQDPQGSHLLCDNYGTYCVMCNLTREQVVGGSSNSLTKVIAIPVFVGMIVGLGFGVWTIMKSSSPVPVSPSSSPSSPVLASSSKETGSQCSTDKLIKKSGNLFGSIEVGAKGVKGKVIQQLATLNEDGSKLIIFRKEKIEDRNVTAVDPNSKSATVKAVKDMFQEIQKRFNIPCEQIVIYGSSGMAEKAPHKKVLVQEVQQATGRAMKFITSEEEASLVFDGVVPAWRVNEVTLVDIGSGNTKGAFLDSQGQHITFSFPFGTATFTNEIKNSQGNIDFKGAAEKAKQKKLIPQIFSEVQRKPGMQTSPKIYLAGGISWALFTLTRPCSREFDVIGKKEERLDSFAPISSEDINTFYYNATQDQKTLFNPDLSNCSAERRKEVKKEIAEIKKDTFTEENLIAGSEILRAFNQELRFSKKEIFFVRSAKDALLIGYLKEQLKNIEEDSR